MAGKRNPYLYEDDEVKDIGGGNTAVNVGGGLLTGATTGLSVGGPWGALAGAIIGTGVGIGKSVADNNAYRAAQEQQNDLNAELADRSVYDNLLTQQAMRESVASESAMADATLAANRAGLTEGSKLGYQERVAHDQALTNAAGRGGIYLAAQQMDQMRKAQVLQEYQVAQSLANNAAPEDDNGAAMAGLASEAAKYGTYKSGQTGPQSAVAGSVRESSTPAASSERTTSPEDQMTALSLQARTSAPVAEQMKTMPPEDQILFANKFPEAFSESVATAPVGAGGRPAITTPANGAAGHPTRPVVAREPATPGNVAQPAGGQPTAAQGAANAPPATIGQQATVHPDTIKAARSMDANALLARYQQPRGEYLAWKQQMIRTGVTNPELLTEDAYQRYLKAAP